MVGMNETFDLGPSNSLLLERSTEPDNREGVFMDKILRGEMSAIEAYDTVLMRFSMEHASHLDTLRAIRNEHELSCILLRQIVREEGREPSAGSGPWGTLVTAAVNVASFLGEDGALRMLKTGEEHGYKLYQEALDLGLLPSEKRMIRDTLIPKQERHISQLAELLQSRH